MTPDAEARDEVRFSLFVLWSFICPIDVFIHIDQPNIKKSILLLVQRHLVRVGRSGSANTIPQST